jgi:hypothetical protein
MDVCFGTDTRRNGPKTNPTNENTVKNVFVVITFMINTVQPVMAAVIR